MSNLGFKVHGSFFGTCDECSGPDITSNGITN